MRRILYATDGSLSATAAGEFLAGLPHSHDVHVHIVTALDPDYDEDEGEGGTDGYEGNAVLTEAQATLQEFPGHVTTARVWAASTSEVVQAILDDAAYVGADLIVVGSQGRSNIARFFLGSVSEALARHASCPVLVVRRPVAPLREILIGVDGSREARWAAEHATSVLPLPILCTARLVRVVPNPPLSVAMTDTVITGSYAIAAQEFVEQELPEAHRYIESLAEEIRRRSGANLEAPRIETLVRSGDPATELIQAADEHSAGLIIVGSRGLSGIERFLLGSVSERVLRHAHCSVLIVRGTPDA